MDDLNARATPNGPPERLQRLPSWLVNQLRVVANQRVAERFGRPGSRTDYAVLASLKEFGPLSQAELGRRLGIDRSDMVALLNGLEHEALVVREQDPDDRRRNAISLTTNGAGRLSRMDREVELAQNDLLQPLDASERATLTILLQRVVAHHHSLDRRSART